MLNQGLNSSQFRALGVSPKRIARISRGIPGKPFKKNGDRLMQPRLIIW